MAITRSGLFTLETSNPRFFTCCSRLHVKVALALVIAFMAFIELTEWYFYIFVDRVGETADAGQAIISVWQLVSIICMILAFITEKEDLLIPYILFMIFVVTSFSFWAMQILVIAVFPYSERAQHLLGFRDEMGFVMREKITLTVLSVFTTITTITGWFLHVGLSCYVYFQSRNRELKVKNSARVDRPPMVAPLAPEAQPKTRNDNFPNPNFSISDDEDVDEDEDKVFEKKAGPSMV
eukprot:NP_508979.2 DAF-16/FOXO Controlled, germline Tumor affecting [Caenorhabditis elegans]